MTDNVTVRAVVRGRVQGVFYRQSTMEKARSLELVGWVKNQRDGSVALEANGPRDKVEALVEWCRKGPPSARVDDLELEWSTEETQALGGFHIVH